MQSLEETQKLHNFFYISNSPKVQSHFYTLYTYIIRKSEISQFCNNNYLQIILRCLSTNDAGKMKEYRDDGI